MLLYKRRVKFMLQIFIFLYIYSYIHFDMTDCKTSRTYLVNAAVRNYLRGI